MDNLEIQKLRVDVAKVAVLLVKIMNFIEAEGPRDKEQSRELFNEAVKVAQEILDGAPK